MKKMKKMKNLKLCPICKQVVNENNEVIQLISDESTSPEKGQLFSCLDLDTSICITCQSLALKQKLINLINLLPNNFVSFEQMSVYSYSNEVLVTVKLNDNQTLTTKYKFDELY